MAKRIEVAVSPFYRGEDWKDEKTGILFERDDRAMRVYSIPETSDLSGIQKAVRLNQLILVSGQFDDLREQTKKVQEEPKEEPKKVQEEPKKEEPKQETKEEPKKEEPKKEEPKEEPKVEASGAQQKAPAKRTRKRAPSKKQEDNKSE